MRIRRDKTGYPIDNKRDDDGTIHLLASMYAGEKRCEWHTPNDRILIPVDCDPLEQAEALAVYYRTIAFGAIRRAAKVARECELYEQWNGATATRDAIRAALNTSQNSTENGTELA